MAETVGTSEMDSLSGQILIAMPGMRDPRFHRTIVYLCAHSEDGAMGLIVNKPAETLCLGDLYKRIGMEIGAAKAREAVRYGGPVETGRGFVLHSADYYADDATLSVDGKVSMTATLDILQAMAEGEGPAQAMVALGYSGWAPGQLEGEIARNGWLYCAADEALIFDTTYATKWDRAMAKIGVDPTLLSTGGSA